MPRETAPSLRNEIVIVVLSLVSVVLLVYEALAELRPHQETLFERVDLAIAFIFLGEFLWRLYRANDRWRFLATSSWELLAAIPLTHDMARALRGVRLFRVIRIVRILRVIRLGIRLHIIVSRMRAFGHGTHLLNITTTVVTIVLIAAVAFHYFEFGENPRVESFWDSLWWAIITVTTVGYGDIYPVTAEGRLIAVGLLVGGLSAFGVFTASIASWMTTRKSNTVRPAESKSDDPVTTR